VSGGASVEAVTQEVDDMEFVGLTLVSVAALTAWLVAARPGLLSRIGRRLGQACLDGLFAAAEWYAEPYLDTPACHASPTAALMADPAETAEATATTRLLDGRCTMGEYHAVMAELARLDEARHPLTLPPLSDR
jgi:hypothetical protein